MWVLGCRVDGVTTENAIARIMTLARGADASLVVTLGTEMIVRAQRDEAFRAAINASALSLCDTIGVLLAARLAGARIPERVTGIDLIEPLCEACAREEIPVFLLGARGDTALRAGDALASRHPGLRVAGARDGFFSPEANAAVAASVTASGAKICFVGLGSPRQELWIAQYLKETGCAVGIGVGGAFDVLAGNVARAPERWRKYNAEWLYRLIVEPQRWRRQLALPYFVWLALRERVRAPSTRRYS